MVLGGPLVHGPAVGLPIHLPGEVGVRRGLPCGQAGELGLVQEPEAPRGWGQQADARGLGVVLTLCGEGEERCEGLGGGAAGLRAGQWPQARPLPRDPWSLLLPEVRWAGARPPLSWGLACRQAVTGAPESTPPFSPTLPKGLTSAGVLRTHQCLGIWLAVAGGRHCGEWGESGSPPGATDGWGHGLPTSSAPGVASQPSHHLGVASASVYSSALVPVGPWLSPCWL